MQDSAVIKCEKAIFDINELLMAVIAYINSDVQFQRHISAIICNISSVCEEKKSELNFLLYRRPLHNSRSIRGPPVRTHMKRAAVHCQHPQKLPARGHLPMRSRGGEVARDMEGAMQERRNSAR